MRETHYDLMRETESLWSGFHALAREMEGSRLPGASRLRIAVGLRLGEAEMLGVIVGSEDTRSDTFKQERISSTCRGLRRYYRAACRLWRRMQTGAPLRA